MGDLRRGWSPIAPCSASRHWTKVQYPQPRSSLSLHIATFPGRLRPRTLHNPVPNQKQPLIAIVDDDESVCRAIERLLRSLGMSGEIYTSSAEFVDLVEALPSFQPDCVVLDIQMPGLNGIEVQTRLRRARGAMPVIFITAHDDRVARERALAGGAVAFLRKPFTDALLIRTLDAALGRGETGENQLDPVCGD